MSRIKDLLAEVGEIDDLRPTRPSNNNIADIVLEWAKTPQVEDYIADHAYFGLGDDDGQPCMFLENFTTLCDEIALDTLDRLIQQEHYDLSDKEYAQIVEHASNLIANYYADYEDSLCSDAMADYNRDKKYLSEELKEKEGRI